MAGTSGDRVRIEYEEGRRNFRGENLRYADLRGMRLWNLDFSGADLTAAQLNNASLYETTLGRACLRHADLAGADIGGADLVGADLEGAYLTGCINPSPASHDFISAVLAMQAQTIRQRMIAGLVLVSRDWCWADMRDKLVPLLSDEERDWIVRCLAGPDCWQDLFLPYLRHYRFAPPAADTDSEEGDDSDW